MSNPGAFRLHRVRATVQEMLRDRGYLISQEDVDMSEDAFYAQYGEQPARESLTILVQKRDDPTDQLFVFWPQDPKVGVKPIKRCALPLRMKTTIATSIHVHSPRLRQ